MNTYYPDGSPLSSAIPVSQRKQDAHRSMFGLYRGVVMQVVYPDDPKNSSKERIEYVVKVRGQLYPNAINLREGGGKYNYNERIRKPTEKSDSGQLKAGTFDELLDGEHVYVMFLEGHGNVPIIVGAAESPLRGKYKKYKKADGLFDVDEFNGIEFLIDKDSNYIIKHVGRKDANGKILNQAAVGSFFKMSKEGDFEWDTNGAGGTANVRVVFTKASKKIEIYAQENKIMLDSTGIRIFDKNGNKITQNSVGTKIEDQNGNIVEMKSGEVKITVSGNAKIDASGNCNVTAGGNIVATGSQIQLNGSSGDVLTTVTDPFIDLITGAPTTGVPTVKAG